MRGGRIGVAVVAAVMAAGLAVGCGSSAATAQPSVLVTPATSLGDQPIAITVHGARQGQPVTVALSTTDGAGVRWSAQATFTAGKGGTVDLSTTAPTGGAYQGVEADGLLDSLTPTNQTSYYFSWPAGRNVPFIVTVSGPHLKSAAVTVVRRLPAAGVTITPESLAATGFVGDLFTPAPGTARTTAVLTFGGSEGGMSGGALSESLASAGYPTLDIAYFDEPGLPSSLTDIPISYFASALTWLGRQSGVDPSQLWLLSGSRGTEAEFLLADHYPQLVHGVIALSASNVAHASFPANGSPAWTFGGQPVPTDYAGEITEPAPDSAATIPVGGFTGPVFLACGTADQVWASCTYEQSEMQDLAASPDTSARCWHRYTGGGHFVASLPPFLPMGTPSAADDSAVGATPLADDDATAQEWPSILSFLAHPTSCGDPVTSGT